MKTDLDAGTPIYIQIMTEIKHLLICGELEPGGMMPSVREMARAYGVNPNTMQKALYELQRENFLISDRGSGRRITSDEGLISDLRENFLQAETRRFILRMAKMGVPESELITYMSANSDLLTR